MINIWSGYQEHMDNTLEPLEVSQKRGGKKMKFQIWEDDFMQREDLKRVLKNANRLRRNPQRKHYGTQRPDIVQSRQRTESYEEKTKEVQEGARG